MPNWMPRSRLLDALDFGYGSHGPLAATERCPIPMGEAEAFLRRCLGWCGRAEVEYNEIIHTQLAVSVTHVCQANP
jgi:hypothetical protein